MVHPYAVVVVRLLQLPGDARVLADEKTAALLVEMRLGKILDRPPDPRPQQMRQAKPPRR